LPYAVSNVLHTNARKTTESTKNIKEVPYTFLPENFPVDLHQFQDSIHPMKTDFFPQINIQKYKMGKRHEIIKKIQRKDFPAVIK